MKIQTREVGTSRFEVTIESSSDSLVFTEDVTSRYINGQYKIDESVIQDFMTAAREMTLFNGQNDVDFLKNAIEHFSNDAEREEILEWLKTIM